MIYACCVFFNEVELLECWLNELAPVVDQFVVVEAAHTIQGQRREGFEFPYWLGEEFNIRWLPLFAPLSTDTWQAETFVRRYVNMGLYDADSFDHVLFSDVDEIPTAAQVEYAKHVIESTASIRGVGLDLQEFCYRLDWRVPRNVKILWKRPALVRRDWWTDAQAARDATHGEFPVTAYQAGWHFSSMGGTERLRTKLQSFTHAELNNDYYTNDEILHRAVEEGKDILGRFECEYVPLSPDTHPLYMVEHPWTFAHMLRGGLG